jgi:glycosyltransferase involved in cell wall biosynthesis
MAMGLPVVAPSGGGPAEVIIDGETGTLYAPGDVDALADALRRLAGDIALRKKLGAAAQMKARDFEPEIVAAAVTRIYAQVLSSKRRARRTGMGSERLSGG